MTLLNRFLHTETELSENDIDAIRAGVAGYPVEVRPSTDSRGDGCIEETIRALAEERKTRFLKLGNASPVYAFEIIRSSPDDLRMQFIVPTKRADRTLRNHLTEEVPGVGFADGTLQLPLGEGDTVGGGILSPSRDDWHPLRHEYKDPPTNPVVGALHPHAMRRTRFVVQVLFQPIAGQPVRSWWWRRRAYQHTNYLRKEREKLWGSRDPLRKERGQAEDVAGKADTAVFRATIRVLVIGAGEYTPARFKEVSAPFAGYANDATKQSLHGSPVRSLREAWLTTFVQTVAHRRFGGWSRRFHATPAEIGALTAVPSRDQENIRRNTL